MSNTGERLAPSNHRAERRVRLGLRLIAGKVGLALRGRISGAEERVPGQDLLSADQDRP